MPKKPPRPSRWRLEPLKPVSLDWLNWRDLKRHPLPPIIISLVLAYGSGVRFMIPVGIVIGVAALWLFYDLLPLASWMAVRKINKNSFFSSKYISESTQVEAAEREQLEVLRNKTMNRARFTYSMVLFVVIASAYVGLVNFVSDKSFEEMREEVREHLEADNAYVSESTVSTAEITVKNKSRSDVLLDSFVCSMKILKLDNGSSFYDEQLETALHGLRLTRGGNGQTFDCTPEKFMHARGRMVGTRCADATWTIAYKIPFHSDRVESKSFRYILQSGHKRWEEVGLDTSVDACKEY